MVAKFEVSVYFEGSTRFIIESENEEEIERVYTQQWLEGHVQDAVMHGEADIRFTTYPLAQSIGKVDAIVDNGRISFL